jgi:hypothetical protein
VTSAEGLFGLEGDGGADIAAVRHGCAPFGWPREAPCSGVAALWGQYTTFQREMQGERSKRGKFAKNR